MVFANETVEKNIEIKFNYDDIKRVESCTYVKKSLPESSYTCSSEPWYTCLGKHPQKPFLINCLLSKRNHELTALAVKNNRRHYFFHIYT